MYSGVFVIIDVRLSPQSPLCRQISLDYHCTKYEMLYQGVKMLLSNIVWRKAPKKYP